MNISVIQLIKLGQKYLSLWPERTELANYFVDYRAVQSARFVCRYFPALAIFIVLMQLYFASGLFYDKDILSQVIIDKVFLAMPKALFYGLFLLSLPIQALVISGVKADKLLPPSLASWYRSGLDKAKQKSALQNRPDQVKQGHYESHPLVAEQDNMKTINQMAIYKPRYIDLAQLLQLTFAHRS